MNESDIEAFEVLCMNTIQCIFDPNIPIPKAMVEKLMITIKESSYGAGVLLNVMARQRGKGSLALQDDDYAHIVTLFNCILDKSEKLLVKDTDAVRMIMVLSQSFTRESDGFYVQASILGHALWTDVEYWECAVFDSIGFELKKLDGLNKTDKSAAEIAITSNQLMFFALNMVSILFC